MNRFGNYIALGLIAASCLSTVFGATPSKKEIRAVLSDRARQCQQTSSDKPWTTLFERSETCPSIITSITHHVSGVDSSIPVGNALNNKQTPIVTLSNIFVYADDSNQNYCSDSGTNQVAETMNTNKFVTLSPDILARMDAKKKGIFRVTTGGSTNKLEVLIRDVRPYSIVVSYIGVTPPPPVNIPIYFVNAIELEGGNRISLLCPRAENLWNDRIAEVTYVSSPEGVVSGAEVISFGGYDRSKFYPISPASKANGILINVKYPEELGK